jgi:hypothetical protein
MGEAVKTKKVAVRNTEEIQLRHRNTWEDKIKINFNKME